MTKPSRRSTGRNRLAAVAAGSVAVVMLGLSFAAVPLYRMLCGATGLAGTTQVAAAGAARQGERSFQVRFDTNVVSTLPWSFAPEVPSMEVRTGQTATAFFKVVNRSDRPVTARATYNVAPYVMGLYFDKISCFCFSDQRLEPGQTMDMPVVFFLDPALEKDETIDKIDTVTLSYTFSPVTLSPVEASPRPVAASTAKTRTKL